LESFNKNKPPTLIEALEGCIKNYKETGLLKASFHGFDTKKQKCFFLLFPQEKEFPNFFGFNLNNSDKGSSFRGDSLKLGACSAGEGPDFFSQMIKNVQLSEN
jgi:hypothetical protein